MGSSKGGQTIGFHYMFSLLFGFGRGPINELIQINVADKTAWTGNLSDNSMQAIQKPELFSGTKGEGGIQGPFRMFPGRYDQVLPGSGSADCGDFDDAPMNGSRTLPNVKTEIGGLISEMRGVTMLWFDGLISSMNPYPKVWSFRIRRSSAGWYNDVPWYPEKSCIYLADGQIHAMNPAHIIYQCLTDPEWGRGLPAALIDENSFIYAANTLCAELFGLCLLWQRKEELDNFVGILQDYIDCLLYPDPETGKMTIRLLRNDFVHDDLPVFTKTTGLIDIEEDNASSQDEIFNTLIGQGFDPITKKPFTVRAHNLAARQSQGATNPEQRDLSGITTRDLMGRVLARDLKKTCSGLKRYIVVLDRSGWKIRPGMPFRIADDRRGINDVVLRAIEITDQSFKDGRITMKCMEDVFSLSDTSNVTTNDSSWTPAATDAVPATEEAIYEANYRDAMLQSDAATITALDPTTALFGVVAVSPDATMYRFDLDSRATGETSWQNTGGLFTGAATLVDAITILQTVFVLTGETAWPEDIAGQAIVIDNEQMGVVSYVAATHTLTVKRGVGDTVPATHAAAATVWALDEDFVSDKRSYTSGETVEAKVLTRTSSDVLAEADATLMTLALVGRQARPYPPAKVTVGGAEALTLDPSVSHAAPVLAWAHRDRLLQQDQLVGYTEASVGPEAGTTYTIRVFANTAPSGPPIRTVTGIAAATWTYDAGMIAADGNPGAVYFEIESKRGGLASYQFQRFYVVIDAAAAVGYGDDYGSSFGG